MATHEEDLIRDAMDDTNKEIFHDAFGQDEPVLDETGDRSHESMGDGLEGEHWPGEDEDESPDEEEGEEAEETPGEEQGEEESEEAEQGEEDEEEAESEEETAESESETAKPVETKPEGRVPSGRLREQTERAERAEARFEAIAQERDSDRQRYERDIGDLRRQLDGVLTALNGRQASPQGAPQQPPADLPPDQFENPAGYTEWMIRRQDRVNAENRQMLGVMRFQNSVDINRAVHGEKFTKAWDAINKLDARNPADLAEAQRIFNAADPGGEILKWHSRQETLRVVGDDPEKYKAAIATEVREAMKNDPAFRKQILDELRAEATGENESRPRRHVTRLPKSLNGAQGQGLIREKADPDLYDDSDQSVFNSAWR
jgi:hypothetical protein